jgi:hypothetical protein
VEKRAPRFKRRLTCELRFEGRRASGIVLDVSASGLFVQTAVTPAPGTIVDLHMNAYGDLPAFEVRARVARHKVVDARLLTIASRGLGLQILDAPAVYFEKLVGGEAPAGLRGSGLAPGPSNGRPFRVRAALGARSRIVKVEAESEEEARSLALGELGQGWQILEVSAG